MSSSVCTEDNDPEAVGPCGEVLPASGKACGGGGGGGVLADVSSSDCFSASRKELILQTNIRVVLVFFVVEANWVFRAQRKDLSKSVPIFCMLVVIVSKSSQTKRLLCLDSPLALKSTFFLRWLAFVVIPETPGKIPLSKPIIPPQLDKFRVLQSRKAFNQLMNRPFY